MGNNLLCLVYGKALNITLLEYSFYNKKIPQLSRWIIGESL